MKTLDGYNRGLYTGDSGRIAFAACSAIRLRDPSVYSDIILYRKVNKRAEASVVLCMVVLFVSTIFTSNRKAITAQ